MDEQALYGLLAEALVRLTADVWQLPRLARTARPGCAEPVRVKAGASGCGQWLGAFTRSGFILAELGVTEIVVHNGRASTWSYLIDGDKVANFVTDRVKNAIFDLPAFDDLAEAWINCAEHFGMISTFRDAFVPHDDMNPLMQALVRSGYAQQYGTYFLWEDAIGKAMQLALCWDKDNLSFEEVHAREIDIDLAEAVKSVPFEVRYAAERGEVLKVYAALCGWWQNGDWLTEPQSGQRGLFGGIGRVHRFIAMIVDNAGPAKSH
jgi:hypothetical protein